MESLGAKRFGTYRPMTVSFGFRTSNARREFETPVLVLGFQQKGKFGEWQEELSSLLETHWDEIFQYGCDLYWKETDRREG